MILLRLLFLFISVPGLLGFQLNNSNGPVSPYYHHGTDYEKATQYADATRNQEATNNGCAITQTLQKLLAIMTKMQRQAAFQDKTTSESIKHQSSNIKNKDAFKMNDLQMFLDEINKKSLKDEDNNRDPENVPNGFTVYKYQQPIVKRSTSDDIALKYQPGNLMKKYQTLSNHQQKILKKSSCPKTLQKVIKILSHAFKILAENPICCFSADSENTFNPEGIIPSPFDNTHSQSNRPGDDPDLSVPGLEYILNSETPIQPLDNQNTDDVPQSNLTDEQSLVPFKLDTVPQSSLQPGFPNVPIHHDFLIYRPDNYSVDLKLPEQGPVTPENLNLKPYVPLTNPDLSFDVKPQIQHLIPYPFNSKVHNIPEASWVVPDEFPYEANAQPMYQPISQHQQYIPVDYLLNKESSFPYNNNFLENISESDMPNNGYPQFNPIINANHPHSPSINPNVSPFFNPYFPNVHDDYPSVNPSELGPNVDPNNKNIPDYPPYNLLPKPSEHRNPESDKAPYNPISFLPKPITSGTVDKPELVVLGYIKEAISNIEKSLPVINFDPAISKDVAKIKDILQQDENVQAENYDRINQLYEQIFNYVKQLNAHKEIIDTANMSSVTNPQKLEDKNVIELTYFVKLPQAILYYPHYYIKYRLPYPTFLEAAQALLIKTPNIKMNPNELYERLLALSNVAETSPDLKNYDKEDIIRLTFKSGSLVDAKLLATNDSLKEQLNLLRNITSDLTAEEILELNDNATKQLQSLANNEVTSDADNADVKTNIFSTNLYVNRLLKTEEPSTEKNELHFKPSDNYDNQNTSAKEANNITFESDKLRANILRGTKKQFAFLNYGTPSNHRPLNNNNRPAYNIDLEPMYKLYDATFKAEKLHGTDTHLTDKIKQLQANHYYYNPGGAANYYEKYENFAEKQDDFKEPVTEETGPNQEINGDWQYNEVVPEDGTGITDIPLTAGLKLHNPATSQSNLNNVYSQAILVESSIPLIHDVSKANNDQNTGNTLLTNTEDDGKPRYLSLDEFKNFLNYPVPKSQNVNNVPKVKKHIGFETSYMENIAVPKNTKYQGRHIDDNIKNPIHGSIFNNVKVVSSNEQNLGNLKSGLSKVVTTYGTKTRNVGRLKIINRTRADQH